jgi:hypothetical protein
MLFEYGLFAGSWLVRRLLLGSGLGLLVISVVGGILEAG